MEKKNVYEMFIDTQEERREKLNHMKEATEKRRECFSPMQKDLNISLSLSETHKKDTKKIQKNMWVTPPYPHILT